MTDRRVRIPIPADLLAGIEALLHDVVSVKPPHPHWAGTLRYARLLSAARAPDLLPEQLEVLVVAVRHSQSTSPAPRARRAHADRAEQLLERLEALTP